MLLVLGLLNPRSVDPGTHGLGAPRPKGLGTSRPIQDRVSKSGLPPPRQFASVKIGIQANLCCKGDL